MSSSRGYIYRHETSTFILSKHHSVVMENLANDVNIGFSVRKNGNNFYIGTHVTSCDGHTKELHRDGKLNYNSRLRVTYPQVRFSNFKGGKTMSERNPDDMSRTNKSHNIRIVHRRENAVSFFNLLMFRKLVTDSFFLELTRVFFAFPDIVSALMNRVLKVSSVQSGIVQNAAQIMSMIDTNKFYFAPISAKVDFSARDFADFIRPIVQTYAKWFSDRRITESGAALDDFTDIYNNNTLNRTADWSTSLSKYRILSEDTGILDRDPDEVLAEGLADVQSFHDINGPNRVLDHEIPDIITNYTAKQIDECDPGLEFMRNSSQISKGIVLNFTKVTVHPELYFEHNPRYMHTFLYYTNNCSYDGTIIFDFNGVAYSGGINFRECPSHFIVTAINQSGSNGGGNDVEYDNMVNDLTAQFNVHHIDGNDF